MAPDKATVLLQCTLIFLCYVVYVIGGYLWFIPMFFSGTRTYFFLASGVLGAAASSGYCVQRSVRASGQNSGAKTALVVVCSAIIGLFVALISLAILLNIAGS